MYCCVAPTRFVTFAGVTAMETSVGGVWTISVVPLVTPAREAEIVVVPAETAVARPLALMVATAVFRRGPCRLAREILRAVV